MRRAIAILVLAWCGAAEDRHIGTIDFYGYSGLDLVKLKALLPLHEGDALPSNNALANAKPGYVKAVGRDRVEMTTICCLPDGRSSLFVGFAEPGAPALAFHPRPKGGVRLPPEIVKMYDDLDRLNGEAVKSGKAGEDDSKGYSLSEYLPQRAMELKLRDWARPNVDLLLRALESDSVDHERAAAAEALGYADESERQIAGLVGAALDPFDDVRNNAIRALGVLVEYDPKALQQIPLRPFVALIHSIDWFDRNKTSFLLDSFTKSRDPEVLRTLRAEAVTPLLEMAQWRDHGHAMPAISALGRVFGIEEGRITEMILERNLRPLFDALK
jgi:hypothetical protein